MKYRRFFLAAATFAFVASCHVPCVYASTFALKNDATSTVPASSSADVSEVDFYLYFQPTRPDAFYFHWKEAVEKIRAKVGNDANAVAAAIRSDASTLALRRGLEGATLENVLVSSAPSSDTTICRPAIFSAFPLLGNSCEKRKTNVCNG